MSARRYAGVAERLRVWLGLEQGGWGLVISPPTEQHAIATALHEAYPERPIVELDVDSTSEWFVPIVRASEAAPDRRPGAFVYLAPHLDDEQRRRLVTMLNLQRDRTSDFGVWVLIASMREFELVRRHAGDLASVFGQHEVVKLEPRPMSEDEIRVARAELHKYYQRRFGRLDLRGFIRSEQEDVSFAVEEIFQPLRARTDIVHASGATGMTDAFVRRVHEKPLLVDQLAEFPSGIALIVGAPGSGKSFFLRWCALAGSRDEQFLGGERPIPVYVPLAVTRVVIDLPSLEEYLVTALLEAGLQIGHAIACEAAAGRVIFLLDGLDEAGGTRQRLVDEVGAVAARYRDTRIIVSSRPTGLDGVRFEAQRFELEGLDDDAIRTLLAKWCELYEVHRAGPDGASRGRAEGEALGREVVASATLSELARFPLLATIIAIVHRSGVRLPDHRVELYEHIVRILVERWNDLRSREVGPTAPTIRVPDAIRLLGPVAYEMVDGGRDGAIQEEALRDLIAKQLARGTIRSIGDADEALAVFRNALGLLVEQAPEVYAFLHKTLAEFLAAHEAVRTGALERLLAPATCFLPKWREVVLLGLGIVGTIQTNDDRVQKAIVRLVENAHMSRESPAADVPALLGAVMADDPALTPELVDGVVEELIPAWWFDRSKGQDILLLGRILAGPWTTQVSSRLLQNRHSDGIVMRVSSIGDVAGAMNRVHLLQMAGAPRAPLEFELIVAYMVASKSVQFGSIYWGLSWDGADIKAHLATHGANDLIRGNTVCVPGTFKADLLTATLAAWRALSGSDPDGSRPPATVEEAFARYGPPSKAATPSAD